MVCFNSNASKLILSLAMLAILHGFPSVSSTMPGQRVHVYVRNEIKGKDLNVKCKSKNNDIGLQAIPYMQNYTWDFKVDFMGTTLFWCNLDWVNAKKVGVFGSFKVYEYDRDENACPHNDCIWAAREDGLHFVNDDDTENSPPFYPWGTGLA